MHLSPALVSISMFALPILTGAAPIPQPDKGGNGGDSYSGAGGNAAGGSSSTPKCDQNGFGDIGLGFLSGNGILSGNGGNGGSANSGASIAGNGGSGSSNGGSGFGGGPTVKLAHFHPNDQQGNNNGDDGNSSDPNGNPDDGFHPYGKTFLSKGKNQPQSGDGGDSGSNIINTSGSTVTYVAGAGGNAYSGAGGNISGSNTSGGGGASGPLGSMTNDPDFNSLIDADALNGSHTNVLNNVLGSSSSSFNADGQNAQNQSQTASANSGPAIAGDGGSINI